MFCKVRLSQEWSQPTNLKHVDIGFGIRYLRLMESRADERSCANQIANTICECHVPGHSNKGTQRRRIKRKQLTCLHCGSDVLSSDNRATGCVSCACDVCPRACFPRYEKFGPRDLRSGKPETIFSAGRGSKSRKLTIRELGGNDILVRL